MVANSYRGVSNICRKCLEEMKLQKVGPIIPYQARHSGASSDVASGRRTVHETKLRGRWQADASLRRYQKGGRLNE